jgi:ribosomal protein S18 acetylase RimI-like enzyme
MLVFRMDQIMDLFTNSTGNLIRAIEYNQYDLWLQTAKITGHLWYADDYITWVDCSPSPSPQGIMAAQLPLGDAEAFVHWVKSQIVKGKAPRKWMTGATQQPHNLEAILAKLGFIRRSETLGMALDLSLLPKNEALLRGLEIHDVDRTNLSVWAQIVGEGLFHCSETESAAFAEVMGGMLDQGRITAYLAVLDGQPAGTSMVYFAEGVAGIYYVAVLPESRGQGIGRAVTLASLIKAQELGSTAAILQATESGARVYRKLGFQAYSTLGRYWLP